MGPDFFLTPLLRTQVYLLTICQTLPCPVPEVRFLHLGTQQTGNEQPIHRPQYKHYLPVPRQ